MKRTIIAISLMLGIIAVASQALAKPNTVSAAEAVGLKAISATQPVFAENLPETTTLDPSALAAKPPKMKKDDSTIGTTVEKSAEEAKKKKEK